MWGDTLEGGDTRMKAIKSDKAIVPAVSGGNGLCIRSVLSLEWKGGEVMENESDDEDDDELTGVQ